MIDSSSPPRPIRRSNRILGKRKLPSYLNDDKLKIWQSNFDNDGKEILIRNAITSIGSELASINSDAINGVNHIFLNTVKKKNVKATNQGHTGRCWMFAGLNVFRHNVIQALGLDNFEFSEVYLFFFDKLERSNSFIQWFIDHPNTNPDDRYSQWILSSWMSDGSWWTNFANLVEKYGLVPKSSMAETWCSEDSDEMNTILFDHLISCIAQIKQDSERAVEIKEATMKNIYSILVKFLGKPPIESKFSWSFQNNGDDHLKIDDLSPTKFKDLVLSELNIKDFVCLVNVPSPENSDIKHPYYRKYRLNIPTIVEGGEPIDMINIPIDELKNIAKNSILGGVPVWYVADVRRDFNFYHSALDTKIFQTDLLFGELKEMDKGTRLLYRNIEGNHAMTLTGVNMDDDDNVLSFQCENSWSYYDNETPGRDGWLYLSNDWFDQYTFQIVVHKSFLTPRIKRIMTTSPIMLEPWESMAPASYVVGKNMPRRYRH